MNNINSTDYLYSINKLSRSITKKMVLHILNLLLGKNKKNKVSHLLPEEYLFFKSKLEDDIDTEYILDHSIQYNSYNNWFRFYYDDSDKLNINDIECTSSIEHIDLDTGTIDKNYISIYLSKSFTSRYKTETGLCIAILYNLYKYSVTNYTDYKIDRNLNLYNTSIWNDNKYHLAIYNSEFYLQFIYSIENALYIDFEDIYDLKDKLDIIKSDKLFNLVIEYIYNEDDAIAVNNEDLNIRNGYNHYRLYYYIYKVFFKLYR